VVHFALTGHAWQTSLATRKARGRWTGRRLTLELDTYHDPTINLADARSASETIQRAVHSAVPDASSIYVHTHPARHG
jgi:divalent metal cation (Fe/Co/Zn/Cd) transporter